ncbi:MAG: dockerin type I domain-containing protein, partial [Pirellulaceae bacterium]
TFSVASAPTSGSLSLNADGSFTYTPDTNFNKTDSFDYVAHDGTVNSNIATVTLQIETVFPWHNSDQPADVNNDAMITPADAIWIINIINSQGSHQLSTTRPEGVVVPYVDVNRDGLLSAHDVLWIINHLNQQVVEAEGDDEGEGEGNRNDLLPAAQPVVDEPGGSPEPTTESAGQSSLPVQSPRQLQLVDDAYRSDTVNHTGQRWLDLDQADDKEDDWWDFLDE